MSSEPAVESFFFTAYANETFETEVPAGSRIRPVTMMSVNELEEIPAICIRELIQLV